MPGDEDDEDDDEDEDDDDDDGNDDNSVVVVKGQMPYYIAMGMIMIMPMVMMIKKGWMSYNNGNADGIDDKEIAMGVIMIMLIKKGWMPRFSMSCSAYQLCRTLLIGEATCKRYKKPPARKYKKPLVKYTLSHL